MKKISLAVLLGLVLSAVLTGCNPSDTSTPPAANTNAAPTAPSTNK